MIFHLSHKYVNLYRDMNRIETNYYHNDIINFKDKNIKPKVSTITNERTRLQIKCTGTKDIHSIHSLYNGRDSLIQMSHKMQSNYIIVMN